MATLYWGGGTGTWDAFTTTRWYTDFARTTLANRAPAADDDVIFDTASGAANYTVTISGTGGGGASCRNLTIGGPTGFTLTIAGSGQLYIYGSVFTVVTGGQVWSFSGPINFYGSGSQTIDKSFDFNTLYFSGSGTYTLQRALNCSALYINSGTLDTNSFALSVGGTISANPGSTAGTLTLGSSVVSAWSIDANAPLVINAGTSSITLTTASGNLGNGTNYTGNTFYDVTFSSATSTCNIYGNNTFNNLTFTTQSTASVGTVTVYGNNTVNGTLTIAGQSGVNRYFVRSDTIGTARTLTVAAVAALTDVDFRDITVAGASAPWSGTRLGDCLGNSNITFAAGVNKYIKAATVSSNWSAAIWATTSGNATGTTTDLPLAQDTVVIDNAGMNTSTTLTLNIGYNIGTFNASGRTTAMTFTGTASPSCYGSTSVSTSITSSISGTWTYAGRTTQTITSNGKTWAAVTVESPGGTVQLVDALNISTRYVNLNNGTFNANNQNVTCYQIFPSGTASKTLTLGSGTITTTAGVGSSVSVSNLTVTANTATITASSTADFGFNGITASFGGSFTVSGATSFATIYGTTTVGSLSISTVPTATGSTTKLVLAGDLTVTGSLFLGGGTSLTQRAFVLSNTLGTQRTLSATSVFGLVYVDFRDINAAGTANWTIGTSLGDCGNNANITFPTPKTVYWNLTGTQSWSSAGWATSSGGAPAAGNYPLPQDTAIFDNTGAATTVSIVGSYNLGTIDASARTTAVSIPTSGGTNTFYGDLKFSSAVTGTLAAGMIFSGTGSQTFTTGGRLPGAALTINKPSGTFFHGDAYSGASSAITITSGTYDTQGFAVTCPSFTSTGTSTRTINLGASTLTCQGTTPVTLSSTGLTLNASSSVINMSSTSAKTFAGGGLTFGTVSSTGGTTNPLTITGSNTFGTLTNSARTYLVLTSGTTQTVSTFTYSGASGAVVRLYTDLAGQKATINKTGAALGFGVNSTNGGNNTNLTFSGTSPNYFYVKDMIYVGLSPATAGGKFFMLFN